MTEYEPQWREAARAKISPPRLRNPFVGWPRAAVLAQWKSEPGWFLEIRDEHDNEMTSDRRFDTRTEAEAAAREEWGNTSEIGPRAALDSRFASLRQAGAFGGGCPSRA